MGFKEANDFYRHLADGSVDLNQAIETYQELQRHEGNMSVQVPARSAEEFNFDNPNEELTYASDDVLGWIIRWQNVVIQFMVTTYSVLLL